ncbi:hypothetical protein ACFFMN_32800 [Planobispora siamensis]|uniref:hypothetical protein n=1 Tax=Planobispora siamensis TaxID=936338 RepID=UPI00194F779F|nr:hypothetical protein [Planobispora siamensis]
MIHGEDREQSIRLIDVARYVSEDPEVRTVRTVGDPAAPNLLVVEMTAEYAEILRRRLGPNFTIEQDLPVQPLG